MELMNLDDFPPWSIYPLFVLAIACCVISLVILFRSLRVKTRQSAGRKSARFSGSVLFFFVASGLALWFLSTLMFERFHAMAIETDQVELMYFWPRSPEIIRRADLVEVKMIPAYRTCGLLVATRENAFRSVNFKKCAVAEKIMARLAWDANRDGAYPLPAN